MKLRNISLVLASFGMASVALAETEVQTKVAIALGDSDDHGEVRLELDINDLGFNLHDLQEGENRSIVDKSGRSILVTREADGYKFDVEGKSIRMPLVDGDHHGAVWVSDGYITDIDIDVVQDTSIAGAHGMDGVMIVSKKPIDDATQQAIKSLLESAGHGSEVRFVDVEGAHGIKVIQERVEVTK